MRVVARLLTRRYRAGDFWRTRRVKGEATLAPLLRLAALFLAAVLLVPSAAGSTDPSRDLLPDLVTRSPAKIFVQVGKHGRRVVRFSNEVVNVGIGPLELRPRVGDCNRNGDLRDDRASYQRIYRDTDGDARFARGVDVRFRTRSAGCTRFHPVHKHWHFEALAEYALLQLQAPGSNGPSVVAGKQVSSCVLDTKRACRRRQARHAGSSTEAAGATRSAASPSGGATSTGPVSAARSSISRRSPTAHTASSRAPTPRTAS